MIHCYAAEPQPQPVRSASPKRESKLLVEYFIPGIVEKRKGSVIYSVGLVQLSGLRKKKKSRYKYLQPPSSRINPDFFSYLLRSERARQIWRVFRNAIIRTRSVPTKMQSTHTSGSGETRVPFMITMEVLMLGLSITTTAIRTRLRRRSVGRLRVEDWCCVGATVRALTPSTLGPDWKNGHPSNYWWK